MTKQKVDKMIITLIREFNAVDIITIDELLEMLEDWDMLNQKGIDFHHDIWRLLIKKDDK